MIENKETIKMIISKALFCKNVIIPDVLFRLYSLAKVIKRYDGLMKQRFNLAITIKI